MTTGLAQLVALAALLVAVAVALAIHAARGPLVRGARTLPPGAQVLALEALVLAPWALPLLTLALALAPSALAALWPSLDHCPSHDHHAHLCLAHPPPHTLDAPWGPLFLGAAWIGARLALAMAKELRALRDVRALLGAARREGDAWVLPTDRVICAVAGLLAPRVVVSEGARARLSDRTLRIALAHEEAHRARRDVARQSLARLAASVHPEPSWLLEALELGRERACDERAAAAHERLDVADALLECARSVDQDLPRALLAIGPALLEARVRALLEDAPPAAQMRLAALAALALALVASAAPFVHHALETLLGGLAH